ncbi:hypothetical protein [Abyssicoccus albus]|uniref:Uncharacterized protein n=1 Tax=Abyssicoccus albus TaxID=1817405 RepID=A0A3N5BCN3_9BACL|nr:hypothetical protein [Abyssicoccus albus]RPF54769.1 hypothetical protein EDD62_1730 [Abyssicoccus albus]
MYTKDFIEKVKSFNCVSDVFTVLGGEYIEIYVYSDEFESIFAEVGLVKQHIISTDFGSFEFVPDNELSELLETIYEYVQTPVEEREEPQKYLFRHKYMGNVLGDRFLNFYKYDGTVSLNNYHSNISVKTHFTIEEAKELGVTFDENNEPYEWDMIPVKGDE